MIGGGSGGGDSGPDGYSFGPETGMVPPRSPRGRSRTGGSTLRCLGGDPRPMFYTCVYDPRGPADVQVFRVDRSSPGPTGLSKTPGSFFPGLWTIGTRDLPAPLLFPTRPVKLDGDCPSVARPVSPSSVGGPLVPVMGRGGSEETFGLRRKNPSLPKDQPTPGGSRP